jgi:hypothetical protein
MLPAGQDWGQAFYGNLQHTDNLVSVALVMAQMAGRFRWVNFRQFTFSRRFSDAE